MKDSANNDIRFPYLTTVGSTSSTWGADLRKVRLAHCTCSGKPAQKLILGIDARFFNDKVDLTVDFFRTKTDNIFQRRANIPDESGLSNVLPYVNIGAMKSWGIDGTLAYTHTFNKRYVSYSTW